MSSVLVPLGLASAGAFTLVLGIVHIGIPRIVRYREAIGTDGGAVPLGRIGAGPVSYDLRRSDLVLAALGVAALAVGHLVIALAPA